MIVSPLAQSAEEFIVSLNKSFLEVFGLQPVFTFDDVLPGKKYGLISFSKTAPKEKRLISGAQQNVAKFLVLIVIGAATKIEADAKAFGMAQTVDHAIAAIKDIINAPNFIYEIKFDGEFDAVPRQSLKEPHAWMVDLSFEVTVEYVVMKDATGKHTLLPNRR